MRRNVEWYFLLCDLWWMYRNALKVRSEVSLCTVIWCKKCWRVHFKSFYIPGRGFHFLWLEVKRGNHMSSTTFPLIDLNLVPIVGTVTPPRDVPAPEVSCVSTSIQPWSSYAPFWHETQFTQAHVFSAALLLSMIMLAAKNGFFIFDFLSVVYMWVCNSQIN